MFWLDLQNKYIADEVSGDRGQRLGFDKMVGSANSGRFRLAFSLVNGSQDLGPNSTPTSIAGSECGGIEFTRDDVEALLSEKMKSKSKFNYKVSVFLLYLWCRLVRISFDFFFFCLVLDGYSGEM